MAQPFIKLAQSQFTLESMALFAIANLAIERGQQIKGDISRLKGLALRPRDVVDQRTKRSGTRWRRRRAASSERNRIHTRDETGCNRFDIAFDPTDLPSEENIGMSFHLQSRIQQRRRVDVGVAVNLPIAQEPRAFQPRDETQHPRLLAEFQMILESDKVVRICAQIFLA